jgi:hypothetical protein
MKSVRVITREETKDFILNIHYAHRMPSISYSFGLYETEELIGICTYGKPPSSSLQKGVCGDKYAPIVWELNRLVLKYNRPNEASFFISRTLKILPRPMIIVSFADTEQNHIGVVYQACNFIYTGLSAKRTDWKVKGMEHKHGFTIADEFRGVENRSKVMKEKYGDNFYLQERSRKHRYIYFIGSKVEIKYMKRALKYPILSYPPSPNNCNI